MVSKMFQLIGYNVISKQHKRNINILENIYQISSIEELENYRLVIQKKFPQYFIQDFLNNNFNIDYIIDNCMRYKILKIFLNSNVTRLRISCFEFEYHERLFDLILDHKLSKLLSLNLQGINLELPFIQNKFVTILNKNNKLQELKVSNASGNILTTIFTNCPNLESLLIANTCLLCGLEVETISKWPVMQSLKELSNLYNQRCFKSHRKNSEHILKKFPNLLKVNGFSHFLDDLRSLPHTTNLRHVSDFISSREKVTMIRSKCPELRVLELINPHPCALFDLIDLNRLSTLHLENFSAYCFQISLKGFGDKLETLRLKESHGIVDLAQVLHLCPNLLHLEIYNSNLKYENFEGLVPKLKTLIIQIKFFQKDPILNILNDLPHIEHLELLNWTHLTDCDFSLYSQNWKHLKFINILNADLTIEVVNHLICNCPDIIHIHGIVTWGSSFTFDDEVGNVLDLNRSYCFHCNRRKIENFH